MIGVLYATLASLGNVVGGLFVLHSPFSRSRRGLATLGGFGAGFMLAVAMLGMLPEALEVEGGLAAVLIGYLVVHLTQHTLTPHFHFGEETHKDKMTSRRIGDWALIGLLPHSFFDGVAISAAFLRSNELGVFVFLAILLHKVPTGVSLASVVLASGNTRRHGMLAVTIIGVATVLGALLTPWLGALEHWGLPLAAGVTIYVAASNLIPESQDEHDWLVQGALFIGVGVYWLLHYFLGH